MVDERPAKQCPRPTRDPGPVRAQTRSPRRPRPRSRTGASPPAEVPEPRQRLQRLHRNCGWRGRKLGHWRLMSRYADRNRQGPRDRGAGGRQHGVVARAHLVAGVHATRDRTTVQSRRLHRSTAASTPSAIAWMTLEGRWMAAALACGEGRPSVTDRAGGWELRPVASGAIHVTVPGDGGARAARGDPHPPQRHADRRGHDHGPRDPGPTPHRTLIDLAPNPEPRNSSRWSTARRPGLIDFRAPDRKIRPPPYKRCCAATARRRPASALEGASSALRRPRHQRAPRSTHRVEGTSSTSSGATDGSWSRSTATPTTARRRRSSATASGTSCSRRGLARDALHVTTRSLTARRGSPPR